MVLHAQKEIVSLEALGRTTAFNIRGAQGYEPYMEGQTFADNTVVTSQEAGSIPALQFFLALSREVARMAGLAQKTLHSLRPGFFVDSDEGLQLPQMMGVTKSMYNALHRKIRLPEVMNDNAADPGQKRTAPGRSTIEGQKPGRRHMKPLQNLGNPIPSLVQMFDLGCFDFFTDALGKRRQFIGLLLFHASQCRGCDIDAKDILHQLRKAVFGNQLPGFQIHHQRNNIRTILHRRPDILWKSRTGLRPARRAHTVMRPVFRHFQRLWFGQIHHLSFTMADRMPLPQPMAAALTCRGIVIDDLVGIGRLPQGRAGIPFLPPTLLTRFLPLIVHSGRLLIPIARWRLTAVRTVKPKTPLKLLDAIFLFVNNRR